MRGVRIALRLIVPRPRIVRDAPISDMFADLSVLRAIPTAFFTVDETPLTISFALGAVGIVFLTVSIVFFTMLRALGISGIAGIAGRAGIAGFPINPAFL